MLFRSALKGICTLDEWAQFKQSIRYDYMKDNNFTELKEAELLTNRINLLGSIQPYVGSYFSARWVKENVLVQNEEEIERMQEEMDEEAKEQAENQEQLPPDQQGSPDAEAQPEQGSESDQDINKKVSQLMANTGA